MSIHLIFAPYLKKKKGGINVRLKSKVDKKNWIDLVVTRRPDLHPESMEIIIYTSKNFMYK